MRDRLLVNLYSVILWSNLTTVVMKMMSKSEDSEQWTAQLYHVHN